MLNEETLHKLSQMKLTGMLENYRIQEKQPGYNSLSFEERLGLMVDAEFTKRQQNRMDRLLAKAHFSLPSACLEDIHYRPDRQLNRQLLLELAAGNYIAHGRNIVINGATGAGKSYLGKRQTKGRLPKQSAGVYNQRYWTIGCRINGWSV